MTKTQSSYVNGMKINFKGKHKKRKTLKKIYIMSK